MRRRITARRFPDEKYSDMSEFEKYARGHRGISSLALHDFQSVQSAYVSPTIIEERQLNVRSKYFATSSRYRAGTSSGWNK